MKENLVLVLTVLIVIILFPLMVVAQPRENTETPFPLIKGSYWIYKGTVKWTQAGSIDINGKRSSCKVLEKTLTWKVEVIETISRGHVFAAILKGHPGDLVNYEEGRDRGDYLIIRVGLGKFYKLSGERGKEALKRLKDKKYSDRHFFAGDKKYSLGYLGIGAEPFLDLPLQVGKVFGSSEWITRVDKQYMWLVESAGEIQLTDIRGISSSHKMKQYRLAYRTNPDHVIVDFVPGVGITRYIYEHHGTPMDVDLKLIEYHAGHR